MLLPDRPRGASLPRVRRALLGLYGPRPEPAIHGRFVDGLLHRPAVRSALGEATGVRLHAAWLAVDPDHTAKTGEPAVRLGDVLAERAVPSSLSRE